MIHVEVLGFDCTACRKSYQLIDQVAKEQGISIELSKVNDPQMFIHYKVLSIPAIVINQKLMITMLLNSIGRFHNENFLDLDKFIVIIVNVSYRLIRVIPFKQVKIHKIVEIIFHLKILGRITL